MPVCKPCGSGHFKPIGCNFRSLFAGYAIDSAGYAKQNPGQAICEDNKTLPTSLASTGKNLAFGTHFAALRFSIPGSDMGREMKELLKLCQGEVNDDKGNSLGCVEEVLLCSMSGHIEAVIIKTENHTRMRVPWTAVSVDANSFVIRSGRHR